MTSVSSNFERIGVSGGFVFRGRCRRHELEAGDLPGLVEDDPGVEHRLLERAGDEDDLVALELLSPRRALLLERPDLGRQLLRPHRLELLGPRELEHGRIEIADGELEIALFHGREELAGLDRQGVLGDGLRGALGEEGAGECERGDGNE